MKMRLLTLSIVLVTLISFTSADIIVPGYEGIKINNQITNLGDFPDYVFISYGHINAGMCPIKVIEDSGEILSYYKFCNPSVYAIPKESFNLTKIQEINNYTDEVHNYLNDVEVVAYLSSIGAKEIIKNIKPYETVPVSSTVKEKNYSYTLSESDLDQTKEKPDEQTKIHNNLIYIYPIIAVIAILIILVIIAKKRK